MKLMREIRFSLLPAGSPITNTWAGWPSASSTAPFMTLRTIVSGAVEPATGYLCNIQFIDGVLRDEAVPLITALYLNSKGGNPLTGEHIVSRTWQAVHHHMPHGTQLAELQLQMTPFLSYARHSGDHNMVSLTESFEFCAAHRLYRPEWSDEKNSEVFGKCSSPNGHGHNYQLEITVAGEPDTDTGTIIPIPRLESIAKEQVLDHLDHKHLNLDCPEFKQLNPSVENIATVIWNLLEDKLAPARLTKVRVWESSKTYAEIEGGI